jgi:hypothetical protein
MGADVEGLRIVYVYKPKGRRPARRAEHVFAPMDLFFQRQDQQKILYISVSKKVSLVKMGCTGKIYYAQGVIIPLFAV